MPKVPDSRSSSRNKRASGGLVRKLLDNPRLPAFIENLDTPTLGKLIRHVGMTDAQELMALATPAQLSELIETESWSSDRPGTEEAFDPEKFLEWILVWYDMGPAFMAKKLVDVGDESLTLALMRLVIVVNIEEFAPGSSYEGAQEFDVFQRHVSVEDLETFGKYAVFGRDEEHWPVLRNILQELWSEDPDLLTLALGRCRFDRSVLAQDLSEKDSERVLHHDLAWNREKKREGQGYATPLGATMFLTEARNGNFADLLIQVNYDPVTKRHLERLDEARRETARAESDAGDTLQSTESATRAKDDDWQEIESLLESERIIQLATPRRLLAGPSTGSERYLQRALKGLEGRNAAALQSRLDEIVYLANLLVAGSSLEGGIFTDAEAAKAVHATCNLGLEYCIFEEPWDDEEAMLAGFLEAEPGLVKAFRIGYHLICQLPHKAIVTLVRELTGVRAQRELRPHPWIAEQVAKSIADANLQGEVDEDMLEGVRDIFDNLSLVFDHSTCQRLRILCDAFPCYPRSLEPDAKPSVRVDTRRRYVATPADLRAILEYLDRLRL